MMIFVFSALLFTMHLGELVSLGGANSSAQVLGISTQVNAPVKPMGLEYTFLNFVFNSVTNLVKP